MEDRKEMIMRRVKEHYDEVVSLGFKVFAVILQGSQNYGLDEYTEEYMSDIDTKAIIIPTFADLVSGKSPYSHTHVRENNEHIDIKDIREMFKMFEKQNLSYLELLVSDFYIVNEEYKDYFDELRKNADRIARLNPQEFMKANCGSAHQKYMAMTHVSPHSEESIKKFGYSAKDFHHLYRFSSLLALYTISDATLKECITLPNIDKDYLMSLKKGVLPAAEALAIAENCEYSINNLKEAVKTFESLQYVDTEMIDKLHSMCYKIICETTKKELLNEEND